MVERNSLENGSGETPETVIEMAPIQQSQDHESDLESEGNRLARALGEVGTTNCLVLSLLVVSVIILIYVIVLIILHYTGIID